jgi:hypothetical protein
MVQRKKFLLRIDPTLWEELNRWASAELRSVNGQIEFILKEAVRKRGGQSTEPDRPEDQANRRTS